MSNTILTPDIITREALRILHQKMTFISRINRQYDDRFANDGAKIGDALRIRLPNEYTVRTGKTIQVQDTVEASETLTVATQKGVDTTFSSAELTMDLDDFSHRILDPAMAVLASVIEADALQSMTLDVPNIVDNDAAALSFLNILQGGQALDDNLAPQDNTRTALLSTGSQVTIVDALKGLFQDSDEISDQYVQGQMGRTGGFNFFNSTHVAPHVTGTAAKTTGYLTNGAGQTGSSIIVDTGSTTFLKGDIITIASVNQVHQETKVDQGFLKEFVITADSGASATTLAISPAVVATGAKQNVTAAVADGAAIVKVGAGVSESLNGDLVFHRDAFTFATADLVMPDGVHFASRQVFDGISMRIVRNYDINNDLFPARIDVLYGFKTLREGRLAARIHADG